MNRKRIEVIFARHGFDDFKWIPAKDIVVSQWVRMKCTFGCREYGQNACCPPNVPSVADCERFFREYRDAVILRFEKKVARPEDRHGWTKKINAALLKVEREVLLSGYHKAFLLIMDTCQVCSACETSRVLCKSKRLGRPAPEAMAVDVFSTARKAGYPIEVLADYDQAMNRYAFLLVA